LLNINKEFFGSNQLVWDAVSHVGRKFGGIKPEVPIVAGNVVMKRKREEGA
jgi:hypothetical protein